MGHVANVRIRLDTENTVTVTRPLAQPEMQAWHKPGSKSIAWTRRLIQMEVSGDLEVLIKYKQQLDGVKVAASSTSRLPVSNTSSGSESLAMSMGDGR